MVTYLLVSLYMVFGLAERPTDDLQRARLRHNLNLEGWHRQAHRGNFPDMLSQPILDPPASDVRRGLAITVILLLLLLTGENAT